MSESPIDPFRPLFASDLAIDVRSEFFEHVGHGLSASTATAHVFDRFRALLTDEDDGPVLIVCVAAMQMSHGQLDATMRDAAIDLIESGEASRAWHAAETLGVSQQDRNALLHELADALRASTLVDDDV